ncbi:TPA: hypothetical protein R4333_002167, partial [Pasteurella multocida]|nr:hypothetical protein [Pasteurella multocida]
MDINLKYIPETVDLFNIKKEEVKNYISFLKKLDTRGAVIKFQKNIKIDDKYVFLAKNKTTYPQQEEEIDNNLMHTLKASGVLLLYSLSEAIASTLMREIHCHFQEQFESNQLNVRKIHSELIKKILGHQQNTEKIRGYIS